MSSLIAQHAQWVAVFIVFFTGAMISWNAWLTIKVIACATHHDVERLQDRVLTAVEKTRTEIRGELATISKEMHDHEHKVFEWFRNGK